MKHHRTHDNTYIPIALMDTAHLINTLKLMRRKASDGVLVVTGHTPQGYAYKKVYGEEALRLTGYSHFLIELENRGVSL